MKTNNEWHNLYITDKNGGKHYRTTASPMSTMSEIRNLKTVIQQAKQFPDLFKFLDIETVVIMLDDEIYSDAPQMSIDDILSLLDV